MQAQANCIPSRHVVSGEGGGGGSNTGNPPVCPDDLGDAPASYGVLRANGGAFHVQNPLTPLRLGLTVDTEPDGQPSALAWGDLDPDEDGLVSTALHVGTAFSNIVVRGNGAGNGLLQAFIDFNGDGAWQIAEQVALNHALGGGGAQVVPIAVPAGAAIGITYMRLRYSDVAGLFVGGGAPNGEVEDHPVRICPGIPGGCCRHIAFTVDASESMRTNARARPARNAVVKMLTSLDLPPGKASINRFNSTAEELSPLQADKGNLINAALQLDQELKNATDVHRGIDLAVQQLGAPEEDCPQVIVVVTDGKPSKLPEATAAADNAKALGIRIVVLGLGPMKADESQFLASLASGPIDYHEAPNSADQEIDDEIQSILEDLLCDYAPCPSPGAPTELLPDLGDAPDGTNHFQRTMVAYDDIQPNVLGRFPSVADPVLGSPFGPFHLNPTADIFLGSGVSREYDADYMPDADGQPNLDVLVDRADGDHFDDGVGFPIELPVCGSSTLALTLTVQSNMQPRFVNAWVDFNRDGDWADQMTCFDPEQGHIQVAEWAVQDHQVVLSQGVHTVVSPAFAVANTPLQATASQIWLRVSVADTIAPSPSDGRGPLSGYQYGETEDYLIERNGEGDFEPYPEQ